LFKRARTIFSVAFFTHRTTCGLAYLLRDVGLVVFTHLRLRRHFVSVFYVTRSEQGRFGPKEVHRREDRKQALFCGTHLRVWNGFFGNITQVARTDVSTLMNILGGY